MHSVNSELFREDIRVLPAHAVVKLGSVGPYSFMYEQGVMDYRGYSKLRTRTALRKVLYS